MAFTFFKIGTKLTYDSWCDSKKDDKYTIKGTVKYTNSFGMQMEKNFKTIIEWNGNIDIKPNIESFNFETSSNTISGNWK